MMQEDRQIYACTPHPGWTHQDNQLLIHQWWGVVPDALLGVHLHLWVGTPAILRSP